MLTVKENEMKGFIEKAYEKENSECESVFNNNGSPCIGARVMDYANDEYCNGLYFKEVTATPFSCIRRWDMMRYFLSFDEIADQTKHGPMRLMSKVIEYVIHQHPANKVVVVVAIPSTKSKLSELELVNYLRPTDTSLDTIKIFNKYNHEDVLTYLPVGEDAPLENQRRLYNRMINMGMTRVVEGEYEPANFVLITPDISYFVPKKPKVVDRQARLQLLLSKGIQIVELNDRPYILGGSNMVNRRDSNAYLYFPTEDIYIPSAGITYRNPYIRSSYSSVNYNTYGVNDVSLFYFVPHEYEHFPYESLSQIITALVERVTYASDYDKYKDFDFRVYSLNAKVPETLKDKLSDINAYLGSLSEFKLPTEASERINYRDIDNLEDAIKEQFTHPDNYNYLFFHIPNWVDVSLDKQATITTICKHNGVQIVFLQEDSRETNLYQETHKR